MRTKSKARVHAAVVVLAGLVGMVGYGLLVGKPIGRWPTADVGVMVLTTLVGAAVVHVVTDRLLGRDRGHPSV